MPFRNKSANIDHIVRSFKILGTNLKGNSILLETGPMEARQIVKDFIEVHDIPVSFFKLCERVLLRTNLYIAAKGILKLRDEELTREILTRLRDSQEFIRDYEIKQTLSEQGMSSDSVQGLLAYIDYGYKLLTDEISFANPKSHEQLANNFIGFITQGNCSKSDDMSLHFVLSMTIASDLATLPEAIVKVKKELHLQ